MNWETLVLRLLNGVEPWNICSDNSGDDNSGGGGKTFTQEELDNIIKARLSQARGNWEKDAAQKLEDALSKSKEKNTELAAQLETLKQEFEDSKLSAAEKERKATERAQKAAQDKIAELEKQLGDANATSQSATQKLVDEYKGQHLSAGLLAAKVYQQALPDALAMFRSIAKVELDENGKFVSATLDEATHTDPVEAAKAFLKTRPWFAQATGGAGTPPPSGGGTGGRPLHELDPGELMDLAYENKS